MQGYARIKTKDDFRPFMLDREAVMTMEQALHNMRGLIGFAGEWTDIMSYLPEGWELDPTKRRSASAATFAASLELAAVRRARCAGGEDRGCLGYPHGGRPWIFDAKRDG